MDVNFVFGRHFGDNEQLLLIDAVAAFRFMSDTIDPLTIEFLRDMPYENRFLRSTYWRVIKRYVYVTRPRKCIKCGRDRSLHIHHLSYEHHGREHLNLQDLAFLCASCHQEEHTDERVLTVLRQLAKLKKVSRERGPVKNPAYDPRAMERFMREHGAPWEEGA